MSERMILSMRGDFFRVLSPPLGAYRTEGERKDNTFHENPKKEPNPPCDIHMSNNMMPQTVLPLAWLISKK